MSGLDVFSGNAFSMQELTASLLERPHVPMRLEQLGIFDARGVRTKKVSVEKKGSALSLVQTTPRGGPAVQGSKVLGQIIDLPTHRLAVDDPIFADEVQDVRSFGSESNLKSLQEEVLERAEQTSNSFVATEEFHRIGAVKGLILDADGSTLINLFTEFGVTAQSEVGLNISAVAAGGLRKAIAQNIIRPIETELGGLSFTGIHVMASSQFMDDLYAHVDVRDHLKGFPEGARRLESNTVRQILDFGGVVFEEYRGQVGATKYVADDKAHAFPLGVPGNFLTRYAPPEWFPTVNTVGLPRYVRMMDGDDPETSRILRTQAHVLHICTRPRTLIPLRRGA